MARVSGRRVLRFDAGRAAPRHELLAAEEPLEIRVGGRALAVTMRTPGDDFDLALGFLLTEGLVPQPGSVRAIRYCAGAGADGVNRYNVVDVTLTPGTPPPDPSLARAFSTSSSCGLCGKAGIDAVRTRARFEVGADPVRVSPAVLAALPGRLRRAQRVFDSTGGLHAAGVFDAEGRLLLLREDVGRHNAFDKVIGAAARQGGLPLRGRVILASGRASFELAQKALMAGIPVLAAVSAPSSLAVQLAEEAGLTLVGFLRGDTFNVYAGEERLAAAPSAPPPPR